jgi:hypothetical protein
VEKNENRGTNRNGRRFDEEFKRDAVAMLKSGERSAQQLSQELGVSVLEVFSSCPRPGLLLPSNNQSAQSKFDVASTKNLTTLALYPVKKALGILGQDPWNSPK